MKRFVKNANMIVIVQKNFMQMNMEFVPVISVSVNENI